MEKVQRTADRWTCRRWRNTSSVGEMLDELQWPTLEARRDQSSLLFFHKFQCGKMPFDKDNYLTPSQRTRSTRSSHNSQYCSPQTFFSFLTHVLLARSNFDHYARECDFGIVKKKTKTKKNNKNLSFFFNLMRSALNSSAVWGMTPEGERLFHCRIVRKKVLQGITVCLVSTILGTV